MRIDFRGAMRSLLVPGTAKAKAPVSPTSADLPMPKTTVGAPYRGTRPRPASIPKSMAPGDVPGACGPVDATASYEKYKTAASLVQAVRALPEHKDASQLAAAVVAHVTGQIRAAKAAGKKPLIITGEYHNRQCSLMMEMAAMKAAQQELGSKAVFMVELAPQRAASLVPKLVPAVDKYVPAGGSARGVEDELLGELLRGAQGRDLAQGWQFSCKLHTAHRLGFGIRGFDSDKTAPLPRREEAMASQIRELLEGDAGAAIVATGLAHVSTLQESLKNEYHVISLCHVDEKIMAAPGQSEETRRRQSYVLDHPNVKCIRASDDLEMRSMSYVGHAVSLGIDVARRG